MQTKTCNRCGAAKPATAEHFHKGKHTPFRQPCKPCRSAEYLENRDEIAVRQREYYQRCSTSEEWMQKRRDAMKAARHARGDKEREYQRQWREKNREYVRERWLSWVDKNREQKNEKARLARRRRLPQARAKQRIQMSKRRAQTRQAGGTPTVTIAELHEKQRGRCWWCNKKVEAANTHLDHRIPLSRGGTNDDSNLVLACAPCNLSKHSKMPWEWIGRLF